MSWPLAAYGLLGLALAVGVYWYERSRPDARIVALVGSLAAFAALGRIAFAAVPNVKPTSDIVLVAGLTLGAGPGFAVGAIAGLASNFFFGQGPWTPWQMAAWGLTGVLGALLARAGRRRPDGASAIGRWPLAVVCAVAGFAFTVVQDVGDWITYSDHSLGSLGAYVGEGLGFDALYAAACLGFALALGPALVRSIARFARRIEVTWVDVPEGTGPIVPLLVIGVALASGLLGSGETTPVARAAGVRRAAVGSRHTAGAPGAAVVRLTVGTAERAAAARAARYLRHAQNRDGGLGAAPGSPSAQLFAGWAALGLASDGTPIARLRAAPGGTTLLGYVQRGAGAGDVGSLERTVLVLRAAGVGAGDVGGRDLASELVHRFSSNGSVQGQVNLTAFGLLALRAVGGRGSARLQSRARAWLVGEQNRDGGYGFDGRGSTSDADDTGAVLEALGGGSGSGAGAAGVVRARRRAVGFLRSDQDGDGGFPAAPGASSNAESTAWATQGLLAAGVAPDSLRRDGHTPLGYLVSLVGRSGAVSYARGQSETPVWVTGETLMALTGTPLPLVGRAPSASVSGHSLGDRGSRRGTGAGAAGTSHATARAGRGRGCGGRRGVQRGRTGGVARRGTAGRGGTGRRPAGRRPLAHRSRGAVGPGGMAGPGGMVVARAVRRMEVAVAALPAIIVSGAGAR